MSMAKDPFESYLKQASDLFDAGDIVQAGQIWQAILKRVPDHEIARAGLYKVKLYFDARATQGGLDHAKNGGTPAPAPTAHPEVVRLLEQGCTLYDAGHAEDALQRWEKVLELDPDNVLAKGYITGARRAQETSAADSPRNTGIIVMREADSEPGSGSAWVPSPVPAPNPEPAQGVSPDPAADPDVDLDKLLRDGCTLYDMGQPEDALRKWEQLLAIDPGHALAQAYAQDARKELGLPPVEAGGPVAPIAEPMEADAHGTALEANAGWGAEASADLEQLDRILREGVQLYDMGMAQEATDKWRQILETVPDHPDALAYLAMAERDAQRPAPAAVPPPPPPAYQPPSRPAAPPPQIQVAEIPAPAIEPRPEPSEGPESSPAAAPPQALTKPVPAAPVRKGVDLPQALQSVSLPSWLASPKVILFSIVGLVCVIVGSASYHQWHKEVLLRRAVESSRLEALAPVARSAQVFSLQETPESIRKEAEKTLGEEPLIAYYRAQEGVRLNPTDPAAVQLFERAKAGLAAATSASANLKEFDRQIENGDLDAASRIIGQLLAQTPEDGDLKARAGRLYRYMSQLHATKEHWQDASDCLRRGRAMFPFDKSWNSRLKLLEQVQAMSKADRAPWIQLLG
ncbi:MAG TPA: hypothetical protein PKL14_03065 [Holophaga sp.]|nr:hypothetical protein [Holophaga sp.]